MAHSRLKGEDGDIRNEGIEHFDERDLPVRFKAAISLLSNMSDVLKREQFCDLVFELSSKKFQAHRLVLALWSPVMMNMLSTNSSKTERIQLTYDQPGAFQQFITFLYTGIFDGNVTDVLSVLLLASTFQIPLLRDLCEEHLLQTVTIANVISLFHVSVRYQLTCLEWQCADHVRQHLPEVAQHSEMRDLNAEQMNSFLGSEHMSKLDPEMKLFLLISWLTEDVPNRQQFLVMLLGHIDWSSVADDFLMDISQTDNFFTSNPSSLYLLLQTLHSSSIPLGPYTNQFDQLQREYSYLLNSVVDSSIHIGMGKHSPFQPIALSLITNSATRDTRLRNIKSSEIEYDIPRGDKESESLPFDSDGSVVSESPSRYEEATFDDNIISATANKSIKHSENKSSGKTNSVSQETSKDLCEGSMKRKRLRPRKIVPACEDNNMIYSRLHSPPTVEPPVKRRRATEGRCVKRRGGSSIIKKNAVENPEKSLNTSERKVLSKNSKRKTSAKKLVANSKLEKNRQNAKRVLRNESETSPSRSVPSKRQRNAIKREAKNKNLERPQYPCSECDYVSTKEQNLDKHMNRVHKSNSLFRCPLCPFECKWNKNFNDHLKSTHFDGPPFICDYQDCSFSTETIKALLIHRKNHSDDRPFVCDICELSFRSLNNLNSHLKCHKDEKKFQCPVCTRCFKWKIALDQHVVTHSDLRPYLCDLCGFSTKYQSHFISHKKKHAGDVFPCTFPSCNYSTPKRSQLKAHMRCHLGIRHHVCVTCGSAFLEKYQLTRHERIHSAVKNHKCSICDYASTRADKLREHMNKHQRAALNPEREDGRKEKKKLTKKKKQTKPKKQEDAYSDGNRLHNVNLTDNDENLASDIHKTTIRSEKPSPPEEQGSFTVNENNNVTSTNFYTYSPQLHSSKITFPDACTETQRPETDIMPNSSLGSRNKGTHSVEKDISAAKQEKDVSAMDLLAHIGISMMDIPNSGEHQTAPSIPNGHFPSTCSLPGGENPLSELTDMMLPGIEASPSLFNNQQHAHHQQQQQQQQVSHHSLFLPTLPVPSYDDTSGNAFPPEQHLHHRRHHQRHHPHSDSPSIHSPHPLIMVPNINSSTVSTVTHQSYIGHPSQNSSLHHHHLELEQQRQHHQQGQRQSSNYSHCDNFSY